MSATYTTDELREIVEAHGADSPRGKQALTIIEARGASL